MFLAVTAAASLTLARIKAPCRTACECNPRGISGSGLSTEEARPLVVHAQSAQGRGVAERIGTWSNGRHRCEASGGPVQAGRADDDQSEKVSNGRLRRRWVSRRDQQPSGGLSIARAL